MLDLSKLVIETPSWGYGDSGTRFGVFPQSGRPREDYHRSGHPSTGTLHEHGVAGAQVRLGEQHPVRGQPGRGQTGRLFERQAVGLGDDVARRHLDQVGEGALPAL